MIIPDAKVAQSEAIINLKTDLAKIQGLTPNFISRLKKLEINNVKDLLWHFPYRYDDFSKIVKIADLTINQSATISGVVKKVSSRRSWKRHMIIVEALIADDSGGIKAVWFNQPYIVKILKLDSYVNFAGKVLAGKDEIYLSNPVYEPLHGISETKHTGGLIPVYPETRGLTSRGLRYLVKLILQILPPIQDFIPISVLKKNQLPNLDLALRAIHFPVNLKTSEQAKKRFAFENLFLLQLNNLKNRWLLAREQARKFSYSEDEIAAIITSLPFQLTASQKTSLDEILKDLNQNRPMNRLLQGDVGSGKTVIAALAALVAAKNGSQAAFMAPTEILAQQHYQTIHKIFGPLLKKWNLPVSLLVNGLAAKDKRTLTQEIASGKIKIVIGTHALIQKAVRFNDLGLIIVDEQHRFGVAQRAQLTQHHAQEKKLLPHFLSMSATPIPRTLSLTLFGDLDISIINELPKGRKSIITKVVAPTNRQKAYDFIRSHIKGGRQAFVICPRIAASENKNSALETTPSSFGAKNNLWAEVKNVTEEYEKLSKNIFPDLKIALLHGKLKSSEKEKIMADFSAKGGSASGGKNKIDILVSTSVIEVGVDVPNASIMVIEGAECFGLAQLYQFRGRIGRGEHQSFCLLFTDSNSQTTQERLNALLKAKNGFELAEMDLAIRGPGEFLGDKQTGLPDLAMSSLNNMELIKAARQAASQIIETDVNLENYPLLKAKLDLFQKDIHLE